MGKQSGNSASGFLISKLRILNLHQNKALKCELINIAILIVQFSRANIKICNIPNFFCDEVIAEMGGLLKNGRNCDPYSERQV